MLTIKGENCDDKNVSVIYQPGFYEEKLAYVLSLA